MSCGGKMYNWKVYVVQDSNLCLFGINWIILFDFWEMSINSFCNRLDTTEKKKFSQIEEFSNDLMNEFPQVFSKGLGCYRKTKVRFEIKEKVKPMFKPKRNVPFLSL